MNGAVEVQAALYSALVTADVAGGRIHDDVPKKPTYPYVHIGSALSIPDDVACRETTDLFIDLHVWATEPGWAEINSIIADIQNALHQQSLAVSGRTAPNVRIDRARTLLDADGVTRHGIVTLQIHHHEGA